MTMYMYVCMEGPAEYWPWGGLRALKGLWGQDVLGAVEEAAPGAGMLCNGQNSAVPAAAKQSHSCPVDPASGSKVLTCPKLGLPSW